MPSIPIYNMSGKKLKDKKLNPDVFDVKLKQDLILDVIEAYLASKRKSTAHTKDRGERRGGGKKPWKQKGTGRARHGSTRSPLWRKGGITFGPRNEKNYVKKVNKKVKKKALFMALSQKVRDNKLVGIDRLVVEKPKTKMIAASLEKLPVKDHTVLFVTAAPEENLKRAQRNLQQSHMKVVTSLNTFDVMKYDYILVDEACVELLEKRFVKKVS